MAYKGRVKYKLDLKKIFNRTYSGDSKEKRNLLRPLISDSTIKRAYGMNVIDRIIERTQSGIDKFKGKNKFPKYSDAYINSPTFKIYRKSETPVNLTLKGDMLRSMDVKLSEGTLLYIQFDDELEAAKAHGHINGSNNLPVRDFFGLPESEESAILKDVIKNISREAAISLLAESLAFGLKTRNLGGEISIGEEAA